MHWLFSRMVAGAGFVDTPTPFRKIVTSLIAFCSAHAANAAGA
jgi:hypothetical protein